jgi:hypothetical protein
MSPELGFALFLTLLWGPTALWLGYRALRGHRSRRAGSFIVASDTAEGPLPGPGVADALLAQGFWVCEACRSVNRRGTKRCYGCKTALEPTSQPAPSAQPAVRMVPVMAEGVAVPAGGTARTTVPAATSWTNPAVFHVLESEPEPVVSAAPHEAPAGVPVCPFLGFRNDPSTRCDFADPRNFCHAASAPGAASSASRRRFIPGRAGSTRSQEIGASHQSSLCLTTAHERCAHYPAVPVVAAS